MKNNKTRFFYVLYSDRTRVFDQSEGAYYPIYIIKGNNKCYISSLLFKPHVASCDEICFSSFAYAVLVGVNRFQWNG